MTDILPHNLKMLRLRQNKSVTKVANEIGIHKSSLKHYEEGHTEPCVSYLLRFSEYYQFPDLRKLLTEKI